jgi:hypothetical protein
MDEIIAGFGVAAKAPPNVVADCLRRLDRSFLRPGITVIRAVVAAIVLLTNH